MINTGGMGTSFTWSTFAPQGWVCPKCGRVYSPTTPICWYCGNCGTTGTTTKDEAENTPTVDVVSWKDFRDFLDDNAEDFESINNRLDALEQTILIKMMERWESLARKAEMLDKRLDFLERWRAKEEQSDEQR